MKHQECIGCDWFLLTNLWLHVRTNIICSDSLYKCQGSKLKLFKVAILWATVEKHKLGCQKLHLSWQWKCTLWSIVIDLLIQVADLTSCGEISLHLNTQITKEEGICLYRIKEENHKAFLKYYFLELPAVYWKLDYPDLNYLDFWFSRLASLVPLSLNINVHIFN